MEKQMTVSVPVIPVNLQQIPDITIGVSEECITGGGLKEKVCSAIRTPRNLLIAVVLNSERTLIDKVVDDETSLSAAELANVCVLECRPRSEVVQICVKVRWPRHEVTKSERESVRLHVHQFDPVSCIKEEIEKMNNREITDYELSVDGQEVVTKHNNRPLSSYKISSESEVKLIIICSSEHNNSIHSSGAASVAGSDSVASISDASYKDLSDPSEVKGGPLVSTSTPTHGHRLHRRASMQPQSTESHQALAFRKKKLSASFSGIERTAVSQAKLEQSPATIRVGQSDFKLPPIPGQDNTHPQKRKKSRRQRHTSEGFEGDPQVLVQSLAALDTARPDETPDLHELLEALCEVSANWFLIGVALKVDTGVLEGIGSQVRSNATNALRMVLVHRLKHVTPTLSWRIVADALKAKYIKDMKLAKEIEDNYIN